MRIGRQTKDVFSSVHAESSAQQHFYLFRAIWRTSKDALESLLPRGCDDVVEQAAPHRLRVLIRVQGWGQVSDVHLGPRGRLFGLHESLQSLAFSALFVQHKSQRTSLIKSQ
jgi:hypothetical protein